MFNSVCDLQVDTETELQLLKLFGLHLVENGDVASDPALCYFCYFYTFITNRS